MPKRRKQQTSDGLAVEPVGRTMSQEQHIKHIEKEIRRLADRRSPGSAPAGHSARVVRPVTNMRPTYRRYVS